MLESRLGHLSQRVYVPRLDRSIQHADDRFGATQNQPTWHMGYGACSVSGCPCQGFTNTYGSELCNNCGHQFTAHW